MKFSAVLLILASVCTVNAVIYGTEVEVRKYPWLGMVWGGAWEYRQHICHATLIHPNWALSDAQCQHVFSIFWELDFNAHNKQDMQHDPLVQMRTPDRKISHPRYDPVAAVEAPYNFDIGLYYFENPVTDVRPVKLDLNGDFIRNGQNMSVAGWGTLDEESWFTAQTPHEAEMTVEGCGLNYPLRPDLFCARGPAPRGAGPCLGDAGGPAFRFDGQNGWVQMGIISSWDPTGCATPSAYARVDNYKDFICENVPDLEGC